MPRQIENGVKNRGEIAAKGGETGIGGTQTTRNKKKRKRNVWVLQLTRPEGE